MNYNQSQTVATQPTEQDILCGRGRSYIKHPGNVKFSILVRSNVQRYTEASSRMKKGIVVASLVDQLLDGGSRFLTKTNADQWTEMTADQIHQKVGHAIRAQIKQWKKTGHSKKKPDKDSVVQSIRQQDERSDVGLDSNPTTALHPLTDHVPTNDRRNMETNNPMNVSYRSLEANEGRRISETSTTSIVALHGDHAAPFVPVAHHGSPASFPARRLSCYYKNRPSFRACTDFDRIENRHDLTNEEEISMASFRF